MSRTVRAVVGRVTKKSDRVTPGVHRQALSAPPRCDRFPPADLSITKRLREVGELVGVRVLDHVIIGHGRYVSFVDDGYW